MAAAVVGVLQSSPVAATTQTVPLVSAASAPPAVQATSSLPIATGTPVESKQADQDKASAAQTTSNAAHRAAIIRRRAVGDSPSEFGHFEPQFRSGSRHIGEHQQWRPRAVGAARGQGLSERWRQRRFGQAAAQPAGTGFARIEIKVDGGQMTARLDAETPAARDTLIDNLPALRDRLQQQDIKVVRFDVGLMGQSSGGSPQTPHRDFDGGAAARQSAPAANTGLASDTSETPTIGTSTIGQSGLNVVI